MLWLRRIAAIALFVGMLVLGWQFAAKNGDPVDVDLIAYQFAQVPRWAALLAAFAAGAVLTGLVAMVRLARMGLLTRRYRKTVHGLEAEVHQLRNLPLSAEAPPAGELIGEPAHELPPGRALGRSV